MAMASYGERKSVIGGDTTSFESVNITTIYQKKGVLRITASKHGADRIMSCSRHMMQQFIYHGLIFQIAQTLESKLQTATKVAVLIATVPYIYLLFFVAKVGVLKVMKKSVCCSSLYCILYCGGRVKLNSFHTKSSYFFFNHSKLNLFITQTQRK